VIRSMMLDTSKQRCSTVVVVVVQVDVCARLNVPVRLVCERVAGLLCMSAADTKKKHKKKFEP
ncbi:MAG: hypothetical protein OEV12_05645, partial [Gammaproteobacteria bacterium]|nr:hypothetical protein [Gammaproteobacteria bacterium]